MVKNKCKHYKGDVPCVPHKKYGVHCGACKYFEKIRHRVLIIKLGAAGDVVRTTPLLRKIRERVPGCEINWLTHYPQLLAKDYVDNALSVDIENIVWLQSNTFDWLINLDKDRLAISLANTIKAKRKSGFCMDETGKCSYFLYKPAKEKWLTGIWDDLSKKNQKNYMEEIFDICGYKFQGEQYIVEDELEGELPWDIDRSKKVVGLNTGCGPRWLSRLWPEEYWIDLSRRLLQRNIEVVLLGAEAEDKRNVKISKESGAKYFGHFDLKTFTHLINQCDLVVTAVTMAMHIVIGLNKKIVVLNNCFNKNEFYLYERGIILEPEIKCDCYYSPTCKNNCMKYLRVDTVCDSILKLINP